MKDGLAKNRSITRRLLKEFWFPLIAAAGWTIYNGVENNSPWTIKNWLNIFGPTFFLASWATGQFFRVKKQADLEKNLSGIEVRIQNLVAKLEAHTKDFVGHVTGGESIGYFLPMISAAGFVDLAFQNLSTYPVFDVQAELIDLDEPIEPDAGKFWTRHRFTLQSLYPNKIAMGAYRFDMRQRERLNVNIFIQTRTQGLTQQLRMAKVSDKILIAIRTRHGENVIEQTVPTDFPGADHSNLDALFQ
jgi:hypothetical protein